MRSIAGKRVLVTGGAAGIGLAIARAFAAHGADLVLVDLDEAQLSTATTALRERGARVHAFVLDVTDEAAIAAVRERVLADAGPIDVLVNNAGVVFGGAFLDVPLAKHLTTYRVNTLGLVAMTHAFLPDLIAREDAHVVVVASASGYIGLPFGTTYASSKWAAIGFSESLLLELQQLGHGHVHVTAICPSYVSTGLFEGVEAPRTTRLLTPERVADLTIAGVLANRPLVRAPWIAQVTPLLRGLLPFALFYRMTEAFGVNTSMRAWRGHAAGAEPTKDSASDRGRRSG
jgi:short-subunit dehydrogenase